MKQSGETSRASRIGNDDVSSPSKIVNFATDGNALFETRKKGYYQLLSMLLLIIINVIISFSF